jgi:hypothetical protein
MHQVLKRPYCLICITIPGPTTHGTVSNCAGPKPDLSAFLGSIHLACATSKVPLG